MRTQFTVMVNIPADIKVREMETYIRIAIQMWRKGGDPETSLFLMDDKEFTVRLVR